MTSDGLKRGFSCQNIAQDDPMGANKDIFTKKSYPCKIYWH